MIKISDSMKKNINWGRGGVWCYTGETDMKVCFLQQQKVVCHWICKAFYQFFYTKH